VSRAGSSCSVKKDTTLNNKKDTTEDNTKDTTTYTHQNTPHIAPPLHPPLGGVGGAGLIIGKKDERKIELKGTMWDVLDLVQQLNTLPTGIKKQIVDGMALGLRDDATTKNNRDVEMWFKAVTGEITNCLGATFNPMAAVKQSVVGWNFVDEFMQSSGLFNCSVVQRAGIYRLLAKMLVLHAQRIAQHVGQPITLKFVLSCCNAIPGLFDAAYPGYLGAGMASAVVAAMKT
jgi:hypothetical protein